jgi:23S rRNA (uracil1939-C5)-methyltransferase
LKAAHQTIALRPEAMSYRGTAVARLDGRPVFISGALPGESVLAEVERERRDFLEARAVEIEEPSPLRVHPRCDHFGDTGSCEWEFIEYQEQLRLKSTILADQLRRIGGFTEAEMLTAVPSPLEWGYRNHARFSVDDQGRPSYFKRASHSPVAIADCAILCPQINALLPLLQGRLGGLKSVELRCGERTGEYLVAPSLTDRGVEAESGQAHLYEELLGRRFRISAESFFQINTGAAEVLARLVVEAADFSGGERVADLYAGVGAFACLVSPHAAAVVAVESSAAACEDGRFNAGFLENVRYRAGLVERVLPRLEPAPDIVLLDPPRSGCDPRAIQALVAQRPRRIVYCSCDSATLARDLRLLVQGGYRLSSTRVVDMFPQTYHIESLSVLARV